MTKVNHNQGKVNQTSFETGQFFVVSNPMGKERKLFLLHAAAPQNQKGTAKRYWYGICMEDPNLFYLHLSDLSDNSLTKKDVEQCLAPSGFTVEDVNVEINVLD